MDKTKLKLDIVKKYYPVEAEVIGKSNLKNVVDGDVIFEPAEGGAYLDLGTILALLSTVIAFVTLVIDIYVLLNDKRNREPTVEEIISEITRSQEVKFDNINASRKLEIVEDIRNSFQESSND